MGQNLTDWTVLDNQLVIDLCKQNARKVARQYEGLIEYDDLLQEAYIACAESAGKVNAYLRAGDVGYLDRWVWGRITNVADSQRRKVGNTISLTRVETD